jgi:hypothetical protein
VAHRCALLQGWASPVHQAAFQKIIFRVQPTFISLNVSFEEPNTSVDPQNKQYEKGLAKGEAFRYSAVSTKLPNVLGAESSACPLLPLKSGNQQGSNIAPEWCS